VANFAGLTTTPSPDCVVRTATPGVSEAILGASARALSRYGVSTLVVVLLVVLTAMAGAIAVLAGRRVPFFPVRRTVVGGRDMVVDTWQTRRTRRSGMGRPRYLARVRYGLLERVDSLREAVRRSVPWRRQRRWPRQTGLSWRIGDFRNKASHADAYVRPSETASRSGERPVLSSQPSGPETASNTARSTLETESRATPVSAVSPEKQNGDQAEMVIRLRREGLSYREISERLTAERGEPVSAATTRRIWREATGRY
jgi:hypothetical protein